MPLNRKQLSAEDFCTGGQFDSSICTVVPSQGSASIYKRLVSLFYEKH